MTKKEWKAAEAVVPLFQALGRACLAIDIQDSHSGNLAMRMKDEQGRDCMAITSSGSQKGDLEPENICIASIANSDYGYYKASSETDIHAAILSLPGVSASMHAHTKELTIATMDDADKPNQPPEFIPIDTLGHHHLKGKIAVDWYAVPSGSPEMAKLVPARLADSPLAFIQGHGAFAKARSLKEAFFLLNVANNSGYVVNLARRAEVDVEALRKQIQADADSFFSCPPPEYEFEGDERCDFPDEDELIKEFKKAGNRIFESRLSPFHTGSMSVRGVKTILYAPKASAPKDLTGPLLEVPLSGAADGAELEVHRYIYTHSDFQTAMHCYVPEAEALAYFKYPGESDYLDRVVPVDAEGSFLYLVIPVLAAKAAPEKLMKALHDYKVVIVRGGGVWAVGSQSLSEVLHHPSSIRDICGYRIGAFERGLNLRKMEPEKAKKW